MTCACDKKASPKGHRVKAHLTASEIRATVYDGRNTLIVPVIMARADVVMNGGLLPAEEMMPEAWNGVPVTVHHPVEGADFASANASPETLAQWHIGRIFNSRVDGVALKGEAWIDVGRAERVAPGLIKMIRSNRPIDVSVGFFSSDEAATGELGGIPYQVINHDVKPDHLALLPGDMGACSWADGCGVRFNNRRIRMSGTKLQEKLASMGDALKVALGLGKEAKLALPDDDAGRKRMLTALSKVFKVDERGSDDDRRQIIADLISNEESPFVPDDEDSLRMMSNETITRMREDYLPKVEEDEGEEEEEPAAAAEGDEEEEKDDVNANRRAAAALPKTQKALQVMIGKALKANEDKTEKRLAALVTNAVKAATDTLLTTDQKAALALATKVAADRRIELVNKVLACSSMDKAAVEKLDMPTLEMVANGLHPAPDFSGRVISVSKDDPVDPAIKAMMAASEGQTASLAAARDKRSKVG